jgi:C-terminal processing protease CtpA/Prc
LDGHNIEGNDVVPDIRVALDPETLASGTDTQLAATVAYIERRSRR